MGLPSSSVTPFFISMYKDSKTLLMLLMKSSSFSTGALPKNTQGGQVGLGHTLELASVQQSEQSLSFLSPITSFSLEYRDMRVLRGREAPGGGI